MKLSPTTGGAVSLASVVWAGWAAWLGSSGLAATSLADGEPRPLERVECEAFVDGLMAGHLVAFDVAGATVTVVRGGEILFAKGYGLADVAAGTPVTDETLFRIGSISKLLVWTAVMQLVEEGKISLDDDVNSYLRSMKVPDAFDAPITLAHLMTHTAGFEDHVIGLFAHDESRLASLSDLIRTELPPRVRPPGEVASYSNHGTALAALVVEEVSGVPWSESVETRILAPLAMNGTTVRQPVPTSLAPRLSKGYHRSDGEWVEGAFEYVPLAPAGSTSACSRDMARFMLAHLNGGTLDGVRILDEETALLMQSERFRHAPAVNACAHGFYEMSRNGQRVIGHGGDTILFHSLLAILPEHGVGVFVSYNSEGGARATKEFFTAFVDRYFPPKGSDQYEPKAEFASRAPKYAGMYRSNRYSHSTIAKLAALSAVEVTATPDGALQTSQTNDARFVETGPLTFHEQNGRRTIAFRQNESGRVTHLFIGDVPVVAFERVPALESPNVVILVALVAVATFLFTFLRGPVSWLLQRHYSYSPGGERRLPAFMRLTAWMLGATSLAFIGAAAIALSHAEQIGFGVPRYLDAALWLPLVAIALTGLLLLFVVIAWFRGSGTHLGRVALTALVLVSLLFLFELHQWNFIEVDRARALADHVSAWFSGEGRTS